MQTALVKVPQEDDIFDVQHVDSDAYNFDIKAIDFDDLCQKLDV